MRSLSIAVALAFGNFALALEVDLISAAKCTAKLERLTDCQLESKGHKGSGTQCSLVKFKTIVKTIVTGKCSTQFPLSVKLVPGRDTKSSLEVTAVKENEADLRLRDGGPIGNFDIVDGTKWTRRASFDETCRARLEITLDKPDVDSAKDAAKIVEEAADKLAEAFENRDNLSSLLAHGAAFRAVYELSNILDQRLADIYGSELAKNSVEASALVKKLATSPALKLTRVETESLERVQDFLASLDPKATDREKRVSDYFSEADRKLITRLADRAALLKDKDREKRLAQTATALCQESRTLLALLSDFLTAKDREPLESAQLRCEGPKIK